MIIRSLATKSIINTSLLDVFANTYLLLVIMVMAAQFELPFSSDNIILQYGFAKIMARFPAPVMSAASVDISMDIMGMPELLKVA